MTKSAQIRQAKTHYGLYCKSSDFQLSDVYGRYSDAKARAWDYCERLRDKFAGYYLKVITHSLTVFTAGFRFLRDGKEFFMYITPSYDIEIPIEER